MATTTAMAAACNSKHIHSSPKGTKGVEAARDSSIPAKIQLIEPPGDSTYLVYREDVSKPNQVV